MSRPRRSGLELREHLIGCIDIYADYLGAQEIKQLNQNSEQFLQAVKALNRRIQTTVTQLNAYKAQTPEGYSCTSR